MDAGNLLRIFAILLGVYLLFADILSLAKRKMTEQFSLTWAVLSLLMVVCGLLLKPSHLERYVSLRGLVLILLIVVGVIWGMWFISCYVSDLMRKNQELAMQISLLNQDSEKMMRELEALKQTCSLQSSGNGEERK